MKKLVLMVTCVALLAAAVVGGQALASNKPADISVSEETSEVLFDWGGYYWGSPLRMKSFEGCFNAQDYPEGFSDYILEESYPEVRHVSLTIKALAFDMVGNDMEYIKSEDCGGVIWTIDDHNTWTDPSGTFKTFEFNTDNWNIFLSTTINSLAYFSYAVTVTCPR